MILNVGDLKRLQLYLTFIKIYFFVFYLCIIMIVLMDITVITLQNNQIYH